MSLMTTYQIPYGVIFMANGKTHVEYHCNININYQYPICINFTPKYWRIKVKNSTCTLTDLLPKMLNYINCLPEILEQRQKNINNAFTTKQTTEQNLSKTFLSDFKQVAIPFAIGYKYVTQLTMLKPLYLNSVVSV